MSECHASGIESFARAVLGILHSEGVVPFVLTPNDEISGPAVLRLVQKVANDHYHETLGLYPPFPCPPSAACFHPNINLPLSVRPPRLRESCPYEDDRRLCSVRVCRQSDTVHGLDNQCCGEVSATTNPFAGTVYYGVGTEPSSGELQGVQGDSAGLAEPATQGEHIGRSTYTEGETLCFSTD